MEVRKMNKENKILHDRFHAGRLLAKELVTYANHPNVIVLGLPRGGVVVAFEIAKALNLQLDVCVVRKLGFPKQPELAMGAIAMGGIVVLNQDVLESGKVSSSVVELVSDREKQELERREHLYRRERGLLDLRGRTVILVDDGIATGSTLRAAMAIVKTQQPNKIVVAVPVAPRSIYKELQTEVDELVCLETPEPFQSISLWYDDFTQTSDEQVRSLLKQANRE
jgi:putative phosphoribosyl transferase